MSSSKVLEAQASGKLTVLFDSGIRTGPDILKALALGAQGVLRPSCFSNNWVYNVLMRFVGSGAPVHVWPRACG